MHRSHVAPIRKIFPIVALAALFVCGPVLATPEKEPRPVARAEWLSNLWTDITAWLTGGVPIIEPPPQEKVDNGCAIDPNGRCGD